MLEFQKKIKTGMYVDHPFFRKIIRKPFAVHTGGVGAVVVMMMMENIYEKGSSNFEATAKGSSCEKKVINYEVALNLFYLPVCEDSVVGNVCSTSQDSLSDAV